MNKISSLLFAFALVVGLTQCKKKVETISSVSSGVYITVDVDGGQKAIVDPHGGSNYATVEFGPGDIIRVGFNGGFAGYLRYDSSISGFRGLIHVPSDASYDDIDYLHFYFTGPTVDPYDVGVDISDQTAEYPVISYGRSTQLYNSHTTSYSATLQNYCAIMKFNITGVDTDKTIAITGMNNMIDIDYSKNFGPGDPVNPYTYCWRDGGGDIALHTESNGERWAILLPQDQVTDATAYALGYHSTSTFTVPAVRANGYYANGVTVTMTENPTPVGGLFSVNKWGRQVLISPGNLQYHATEGWRFAQNQYDICQTYDGAWDTSGWVDFFGWGTWGDGKDPMNTSTTDSDYQWSTDFTGTLNGYSTWRTLTRREWAYLLRKNPETPRGISTVAGVVGYVIRPDSDTTSVASSYTAEAWTAEEDSGSVFLPLSGSREGGDVTTFGPSGVLKEGIFWSSDPNPWHDYSGWAVGIDSEGGRWSAERYKHAGYSVRLARDNW